jgi:hypothetical protein
MQIVSQERWMVNIKGGCSHEINLPIASNDDKKKFMKRKFDAVSLSTSSMGESSQSASTEEKNETLRNEKRLEINKKQGNFFFPSRKRSVRQ